MTSRYRLFAGALLATAMAMPAYSQTQFAPAQTPAQMPAQTPAQAAPTQTRPAPSMQQQTMPQQNMQPRQGVAPSNAEIAADAVSEPEAGADDVTIEDSAILPSAEGHEASRAPSMALDCEKNPQDCAEPLTRPTTGPGLSTTTQTQPAPSAQQQTTQQPMQQRSQPQPQPMQQQTTPQQTSPQQPMQQQNMQQQGAAPTNAELAADAVTEPETDADDVTIEDSAILPSAEGHEASRAPSMALDCEKNPDDCVEELTRSTTGPALSTPPR